MTGRIDPFAVALAVTQALDALGVASTTERIDTSLSREPPDVRA